MHRKFIPFLALTLLVATSGCSQQTAPLAQGALTPVQAAPLPPPSPVHQPAIEGNNPCLPPGPCNYPSGGAAGFIR
jgi:hypothetical protein